VLRVTERTSVTVVGLLRQRIDTLYILRLSTRLVGDVNELQYSRYLTGDITGAPLLRTEGARNGLDHSVNTTQKSMFTKKRDTPPFKRLGANTIRCISKGKSRSNRIGSWGGQTSQLALIFDIGTNFSHRPIRN
jgi:hypothetical protein